MCLEFLGVWTNVWYFQESSSSLEEWLSTNGWSWRFLSHLLFSRYKFCRPVFRRMRATTVGEITLIWFNNFTFLFIWEPCFGLRSSRSFCDALQPLRTFSWLTTTVLYSLTLRNCRWGVVWRNGLHETYMSFICLKWMPVKFEEKSFIITRVKKANPMHYRYNKRRMFVIPREHVWFPCLY